MNPLYEKLYGGARGQNSSIPRMINQDPNMANGRAFATPAQKMSMILQAMRNPAQFVKNAIPDLPENIANDPNQILQYLKQTRGITDQQIQMAAGQIPRF